LCLTVFLKKTEQLCEINKHRMSQQWLDEETGTEARPESNFGDLDLSWSCLDWESWSWHWQKVSLDSHGHLDSFKKLVLTNKKSWFCLNTTIQSQNSQSRSKNLSRTEIFGKSWQFVSILVESELILSFFYQKVSIMLRYLDKSWKVLTNLKTILVKILTQLNLDSKVSILKILTKIKNLVRIISTSFKSWSWQIKKSQPRSRLSRPPSLPESVTQHGKKFYQVQKLSRPKPIGLLASAKILDCLANTIDMYGLLVSTKYVKSLGSYHVSSI